VITAGFPSLRPSIQALTDSMGRVHPGGFKANPAGQNVTCSPPPGGERLRDDADRQRLIDGLGQVVIRYGWEVPCYVVMAIMDAPPRDGDPGSAQRQPHDGDPGSAPPLPPGAPVPYV
jgi:hypothetical protein